jgi:hypothetical protein
MTDRERPDELVVGGQADVGDATASLPRVELSHDKAVGGWQARRFHVPDPASTHAALRADKPGATEEDDSAPMMTVSHQAMYADAVADLAAGRLDAGVLKLGEIAYQEPAGALERAEAGAPRLAWADVLLRAREQAAQGVIADGIQVALVRVARERARQHRVLALVILACMLAVLALLTGVLLRVDEATPAALTAPSASTLPLTPEARFGSRRTLTSVACYLQSAWLAET